MDMQIVCESLFYRSREFDAFRAYNMYRISDRNLTPFYSRMYHHKSVTRTPDRISH